MNRVQDLQFHRRELEAIEAQRRVSVVALALGLARGVVEQVQDASTGARSFSLRVRDDRALPLGDGMLGAADALVALRKQMPAVYDSWVSPLLADVAALDDSIKSELKALTRNWANRLQDLELDGKIRGPEYRDLNEARTILSGVVGD